MALEIRVEGGAWDSQALEGLAGRAVQAVLAHQGLDWDLCEINLLACDDSQISALNTEFRGKPVPTNVLSWPAQELAADTEGGMPRAATLGFDGVYELGDIAISFDTCAIEANAAQKPMTDHLTHLIVHGTLHLLGYDHIDDADAALMEGIEVEILGKMGLNDPYRE